MPSLRTFLASPLGRHPSLLVRKAADRLGLRKSSGPLPPAPVERVTIPAGWSPLLRRWLALIPHHGGLHPFHRVFGREFDEAMLLELCVTGPKRGTRDVMSDIKLVWDFSRAHPLVLNAWTAPESTAASAAFLRRWTSACADTDGPAWTCAMDVAIRAVNWIFADALTGGALGREFGERDWAAWLWRHGLVIWRRLESRMIPSNHYLADLLGLIVIGSVFPNDAPARRWLDFARREFPRALLAQTHPDGGLDEASLRYHAFVTEMALLARLASGGAFPPAAEERLRSMCQVVADFREATGDVFPFGDDDSGRVLAIDDAATVGRADILSRLAETLSGWTFSTRDVAIYRDSGWWMRRAGEFVVAVEFGGVGLRGFGSHAHNDDLSLCVEWRGLPVIVDPGSYLYTPDPEARNQFRSATSHNSIVVDGREPLALTHELFHLPGRPAAWPATESAEGGWSFTCSPVPGSEHRREVQLGSGGLEVYDQLVGAGRHHVRWSFHLHPDWAARVEAGRFVLSRDGKDLLALTQVSCPARMKFEVRPGEFSARYGHRCPTQVCEAVCESAWPMAVKWRLHPLD